MSTVSGPAAIVLTGTVSPGRVPEHDHLGEPYRHMRLGSIARSNDP
ncbi:hypothetical protein [Streptosporangium subroseum]|nr:hypothetical protein OHB15_30660 [Streptosporangium subroseum]